MPVCDVAGCEKEGQVIHSTDWVQHLAKEHPLAFVNFLLVLRKKVDLEAREVDGSDKCYCTADNVPCLMCSGVLGTIYSLRLVLDSETEIKVSLHRHTPVKVEVGDAQEQHMYTRARKTDLQITLCCLHACLPEGHAPRPQGGRDPLQPPERRARPQGAGHRLGLEQSALHWIDHAGSSVSDLEWLLTFMRIYINLHIYMLLAP